MQEYLHYSDIKSLAIQLFVQQLVEANNEEKYQCCTTLPLWGESMDIRWIPLIKG